MGKQAEQAAIKMKNAKAAKLYEEFRALKINTGELIQKLVGQDFYTKGQLKTKHNIGSEHFQRAAARESTGITTEQREKLLREFTSAHDITYTQPSLNNRKYNPSKTSGPQANAA